MQAPTFRANQTIHINEVAYHVIGPIDSDTIQIRNVASGELRNEKIFNLLNSYVVGELKTSAERQRDLSVSSTKRRPPARMDHMSAAAKADTRRRIDYLVRLERLGAFESTREGLVNAILEVANLRGEEAAPHFTTIYRWRSRYLHSQKDVRALFSNFQARGGRSQDRLHPSVEALIHVTIEDMLASQRTWSAEDIFDAVCSEIRRQNLSRVRNDQLIFPSLRTIQRRLRNVPAFDICVARFGLDEAERRFAKLGAARRTKRILELVEIDHTPVDLMVVDKDRKVLGRPTLTVAIDRFSRCILGYHLSLDGHGVFAVFETLRHALLPKTYLQEKYADLNLSWDCFGWFERIIMDNGSEFHADAVADSLANLGIVAEFAKSRSPNDKPHVERFVKTFNYSFIHRLPGTTLSKILKRIGFRSEDEATLTLEELDRLVHLWICSRYHLRPHAGLGFKTPVEVWRASAQSFPPLLKLNAEDLVIEFSHTAESALQHYGIDLNNFRYSSRRLHELHRLLPAHSRVNVKWPFSDVGHVFIWDPIDRTFFKAFNNQEEFVGLSLEQSKAIRRKRSEASVEDACVRAAAGDLMRDMVRESLADKKLKTRKRGARLDRRNSSKIRNPSVEADNVTQAERLPTTLAQASICVEEIEMEIMEVNS